MIITKMILGGCGYLSMLEFKHICFSHFLSFGIDSWFIILKIISFLDDRSLLDSCLVLPDHFQALFSLYHHKETTSL
jgi:hypothetical protein